MVKVGVKVKVRVRVRLGIGLGLGFRSGQTVRSAVPFLKLYQPE